MKRVLEIGLISLATVFPLSAGAKTDTSVVRVANTKEQRAEIWHAVYAATLEENARKECEAFNSDVELVNSDEESAPRLKVSHSECEDLFVKAGELIEAFLLKDSMTFNWALDRFFDHPLVKTPETDIGKNILKRRFVYSFDIYTKPYMSPDAQSSPLGAGYAHLVKSLDEILGASGLPGLASKISSHASAASSVANKALTPQ